jgi:hypothetical protein
MTESDRALKKSEGPEMRVIIPESSDELVLVATTNESDKQIRQTKDTK